MCRPRSLVLGAVRLGYQRILVFPSQGPWKSRVGEPPGKSRTPNHESQETPPNLIVSSSPYPSSAKFKLGWDRFCPTPSLMLPAYENDSTLKTRIQPKRKNENCDQKQRADSLPHGTGHSGSKFKVRRSMFNVRCSFPDSGGEGSCRGLLCQAAIKNQNQNFAKTPFFKAIQRKKCVSDSLAVPPAHRLPQIGASGSVAPSCSQLHQNILCLSLLTP